MILDQIVITSASIDGKTTPYHIVNIYKNLKYGGIS